MDKVTEKDRGKGVHFERIRRITGYLTGSLDSWNTGKRAEEKDRVKHDREYGIIYDEKEEVENS